MDKKGHEHHSCKDGKSGRDGKHADEHEVKNVIHVKDGRDGRDGHDGKDGKNGHDGKDGKNGHAGKDGKDGRDGNDGCDGKRGKRGKRGHTGNCGPQGPRGCIEASDFYALMPYDNSSTVAPGTDIQFPSDGPNTGKVLRTSASTFILPTIGLYHVEFQVSVTEPAQLCIALNLVELPYTVVGRATGTSQLVGTCLIRTTSSNSILSVRNPASASTALTITPLAGGNESVSAHLVIMQIS